MPRLINTLCDNLLLEGCLAGQPLVSPQMAREVAASLGFPLAGGGVRS